AQGAHRAAAQPRHHHRARRARDGAGDGRDRSHRGPQLRPEDRRGQPGGGPERPAGEESLAGRRLMLAVRDLFTAYGKIEALKGVSLEIEPGSITCLLGPNGAGKTTLMLTIAGVLRPKSGRIELDGKDIAGQQPD